MGWLVKSLGMTIEYNFYVSYHGMNPCDTAESHGKRKVAWWMTLDKNQFVGDASILAEIVSLCKFHIWFPSEIRQEFWKNP